MVVTAVAGCGLEQSQYALGFGLGILTYAVLMHVDDDVGVEVTEELLDVPGLLASLLDVVPVGVEVGSQGTLSSRQSPHSKLTTAIHTWK